MQTNTANSVAPKLPNQIDNSNDTAVGLITNNSIVSDLIKVKWTKVLNVRTRVDDQG